MKPTLFTFVLSLAALPVLAAAQDQAELPPQTAADPAPAGRPASAAPAAEQDPTLAKLKNLKPDDLEKVKKAINDASNFVGGIRLQEALQSLAEAEAIVPDLFMVHNLKGAVYTKMRLFDDARTSFTQARQLNPGSFHPKFNLAEIEFVEAASKVRSGDSDGAKALFASAQKQFASLIQDKTDEGTKKLMEFKVVICQLQQGQSEAAQKSVSAFSYIDDEPVYYLGHAAIEFNKGDKIAAQEWLDSANRIYTAQQVTIYMDSFIEIGWVETLAL